MSDSMVVFPRAVYLMNEIDDDIAGGVMKDLLARDQVSCDPIRLFIHSNGGIVDEANYIRNLIPHLVSPVITIGVGLVQSSALAIFARGALRLAYPKTQFLFHEVYCDMTGEEKKYTAHQFDVSGKEYAQHTQDYLEACTSRLSTHVHPCKLRPRDLLLRINKAKADERKEYIIRPRTALRLGFIDGIIKNTRGIEWYERMLKDAKQKR